MIKKLILDYKIRKNSSATTNCSYHDAKEVGVFYDSGRFLSEMIKETTDHLQNDGKKVTTLSFSSTKTEGLGQIDKSSVSVFGEFRDELLEGFVQKEFDFLLLLSDREDVSSKYIIASSKAKCKIGFEHPYWNDVLHLAIGAGLQKQDEIRTMLKYIRMIA
ncbi:MAG: hypothetical protein AAF789_06405, partial [Bacteroidota bacterium]